MIFLVYHHDFSIFLNVIINITNHTEINDPTHVGGGTSGDTST